MEERRPALEDLCAREVGGRDGIAGHASSSGDSSVYEAASQRIDHQHHDDDDDDDDGDDDGDGDGDGDDGIEAALDRCCIIDDAWTSPRISFSQDFVVESASSGMIRVSADPQRWEPHGEDGGGAQQEFEFDITRRSCSHGEACAGEDQGAMGLSMLSAEELFCDGKLLPLQINREDRIDPRSKHDHSDDDDDDDEDDRHDRHRHRHHHHHHHHRQRSCRDAECGNMVKPSPSPSSLILVPPSPFMPAPSPSPSPTLLSSPSPSPSPSAGSMASIPSASKSPPHHHPHQSLASTYSARFKTLFKQSSKCTTAADQHRHRHHQQQQQHMTDPQQLHTTNNGAAASTRENPCHGSRKMIPMYMPPMPSFWPFSRSNSAGEKKSASAIPHCLGYRSNSAGEASSSCKAILPHTRSHHLYMPHLSASSLLCTNAAHATEGCAMKPNGKTPTANDDEEDEEDEEEEAGSSARGRGGGVVRRHGKMEDRRDDDRKESKSGEEDGDGDGDGGESDEGDGDGDEGEKGSRALLESGEDAVIIAKAKKKKKKKMMKMMMMKKQQQQQQQQQQQLQQKHLKMKGCSANAPGRIVLKNLERCCAEKKQMMNHRHGSSAFPMAARVSPVLNVGAIYRSAKTPANNSNSGGHGFFSSLFHQHNNHLHHHHHHHHHHRRHRKEDPLVKEGALNWRKGA